MQELTRRTFLKSATIAGAAAAFGGALTACTTQTEPEPESAPEAEPGAAAPEVEQHADEELVVRNWDYVTSGCHGCITSCPVKIYTEDGVAKKIEGHPYGEVSHGSLCVKGLNQLHTAYSPRHVIYPMRRTGARGAENMAFERVSWEEAIDEASDRIVEILEKYGTYSFLATTGGGGAFVDATQPPEISMSVFSPNAFEPGAAQCFMPRMCIGNYMGMPGQSMADHQVSECFKGFSDIDKAAGIKNDTVAIVLWGTQPSSSQVSRAGRGMAELRANGTKTVVVDPNFSPDAAKATVHLPLRPGSDCALLLSWYRYIFENELYDVEFTKYFTNLPFLINPDTKLAYKAKELFPDYEQTTPANTPVYVCVDEDSGEIVPLPFGDPAEIAKTVNPSVFATVEIDGKTVKSAGQIYKEEAEPWTLERAEEFCWVPADRNEAAIKIYTDPLKEGKAAGITHGVATDMMEISSQAPLGTLGLDAIMGYVNKPGATQTSGIGLGALLGGGGGAPTRPIQPMYTGDHGYGYIVGLTEEENLGRVSMEDPKKHEIYAKIARDRLGVTNHRSLTAWNQSHIPAVRQAIETGEPWRPRIWLELSGNKLCVIGSAGAWFKAVMENMDFVVHQYPNFTSIDAELTDIFLPTEEWLEMANAFGWGSTFCRNFAAAPVMHLGETVNPARPYNRLMLAVYEKANKIKDKIVFTGSGQTIEELGLEFPLVPPVKAMSGAPYDPNANNDMSELMTQIMMMSMPLGLPPEATEEDYLNAVRNNPHAFGDSDPKAAWTYGQHLVAADDGLPKGFATESRKVEVYCEILIKNSRTGFPYNWPEGFDEPADERIGCFDGEYAPICRVPLQKEAPQVENSEGYIMDFDPDFPLALTSGRRVFYHHGTMRHAPFSRELYPVPFVSINPKTAAEYGIEDGDWVEISSRRTVGEEYDVSKRGTERAYAHEKDHTIKSGDPIHTIAHVTEMVAPNVLWMERFWNPECFDKTQDSKTGGWAECGVNVLTNAVDANFNEAFGSYTNRAFAVNIKKSERPERIWVTPEEFQPFMPTEPSQVDDSIGVLMENKEVHNHFTDFDF